MAIKKVAIKTKSREQRAKEYAMQIFAKACERLIENIQAMPKRPGPKEIKEMMHNRFDVAVDCAEIFDMRWESVKGRFKEVYDE
jgi:hypothetical protein